jgi:hypothetical protein
MALIKVKLPSGEIQKVKVPDDWDQEQISAAMKKHFPIEEKFSEGLSKMNPAGESNTERTGVLGVVGDIARGTANAVKGGVGFLANTPQMTEDLGEQLLENPGTAPLRGLGQIAAEGAEIGKGLVNMPYNLNQYLARKHLLPQLIGKLGKFIPHIPEDTGIEKLLGLEERKGDKLLRGLTEAGGLVAGGAPLAKSIAKKVTAPSKERLFKRALEEQIDLAAKEKGLATDEFNSLKESLRDQYSKIHGERVGELTPIGQKEQINIKKLELEANPKKGEIPEGELPSIPEKPDTTAMLDEHKKAIDEAKDAAEKGLDILDNPTIKAGGKIKQAIEHVKNTASSLYDAARNHYKDKQILADNSAEIRAVTKDLEELKAADELAPGYGSGTTEQKALEEQLQALKEEKVNASDIFDLQRTLEKMAENTRGKQFESGTGRTDLERKRLGEIAQKLDSHADTLAKRLESVGGKDVQKMIIEANKGWRVFKELSQGKYENGVFKSNPVGKAALKSGNVPNNALIELAKDHPANDFLKGLVDTNTELRKHLLAAYSGEKNVNKLLKPSSVIDNYIKSLPEVEERLNAFKNAIADYKAGEKEAGKINKAHEELVKSMKDAAEAKQLQQQIKFHEEAIPEIKAKMDKVDKKSVEHEKLQKQLKEHEQKLADKNHLLRKYGKTALGVLGINELTRKLGF